MIPWTAVFLVTTWLFGLLWLLACAAAAKWRREALKADSRLKECQRQRPSTRLSIEDRRRAVKLLSDFETAVCKQHSQAVRFGDAQGSQARATVNDARQAILDRMRPMELEDEETDDDGD